MRSPIAWLRPWGFAGNADSIPRHARDSAAPGSAFPVPGSAVPASKRAFFGAREEGLRLCRRTLNQAILRQGNRFTLLHLLTLVEI